MKPGKILLDYAGKMIFPKIWNDIKNSVDIAELTFESIPKSGDAKKAFAISRMKELGFALADGLLKAALYLAWMWLQSKQGKDISATKGGVPL